LAILLEGPDKVEGAKMDIAGDGPDRSMIEEKVRSLVYCPDLVRFLGTNQQPKGLELLKRTDVFYLSSCAKAYPWCYGSDGGGRRIGRRASRDPVTRAR